MITSQFCDPVLPAGRDLEALPLVFADALQFMQIQHYSSPAVRSRALYVVGPNEALRHIRANTIEKNLLAARPFFSVPMVSWEDLPRRYPSFLLLWRRGTFVWLPSALEVQNAHMTFVASSGDALILLVNLSDSSGRPASTN